MTQSKTAQRVHLQTKMETSQICPVGNDCLACSESVNPLAAQFPCRGNECFIKYLLCVKGCTFVLSVISYTTAASTHPDNETGHSGVLCSVVFFLNVSLNASVQFSSVAQSCPTLCDPMNHSTPGLPVHHHLLEFTQTHVHRVSDAIQPSHPLLSPSPPAPNPSQHHSLF